jgi:hypothetical protein
MGARTPLFLVRPDAKLVRMTPSAPDKEDDLQCLIADYPELIGDDDGGLLLIEREHGIADAADGSPRWSLDHLFVTRAATPVLVEVKRAVDTRLRREVVGQLLDYAANGVAYWPAGAIAARFEAACDKRGANPTEELDGFLRDGQTPAEFWAQVDANFRAGRIKLVFVADEIPSELARIVEFLNDQMDADVRAVELRYFEGPDGERTLAPRVIGETERTRAQKSGARPRLDPISQEDWIAKHIAPLGPKVLQGASALLEIMGASGAQTGVPSTQGSIYSSLTTVLGRSVYPLFLLKNGTAQIGFGWVTAAPALSAEETRRAFYERFAAAVGPLSAKWHPKGFPSFPLERLANPDQLAAFREVAEDFFAACRAEVPPDR